MITAIIAMESEAEILLKNATVTAEKTLLGKKTYEGEFHGKKFALVICGVGKVNAAVGAAAGITAYRPSSVLNFGVAGGLNESAKLCEVYAINKAVQFDFDLTQLNGGKIGAPVVKRIKIYELDRQKNYDCGCAAAVKKINLLDKKRFTMNDVLTILRYLRDPVNGCPWDKVQTSESIRMNVIEEAYELLDAINLKDDDKIREETGDILMQVAFHATLKEEAGAFDFTDVATELCEKLITRHTHVFGKDKALDADGALNVWDKNKMIEKHQDTFAKAVNDVPKCFPALLQAQKVAKRVERGGWDKPTFESAKAALEEELAELKAETEKSAAGRGDKAKTAEELGDALFCMATMARAVGADAEEALLDTVIKVQRRYTEYEKLVLADGKDVNALTKPERDEYYERAKEYVNSDDEGKA